MKKTLAFLMLALFTLGCGKDDDAKVTPTYKIADLIADWSLVSSDIESDCESEILEIDAIEVTVTSDCGASSVEYDFPYSFDGKNTITSTDQDLEFKMVILELTSTSLKIEWYFAGMQTGTSTYEKI